MERPKQRGADLVYRCGKGHINDHEPPQSDKYSGELVLTPLELIDRISAVIHKILDHIGVYSQAPRITPARGPPLWDDCGAQEPGEGVAAMPHWDALGYGSRASTRRLT